MPSSKISVTEGVGKNTATNSISEDGITKEIQRVQLNDNAGADILGKTSDAASTDATATASLMAFIKGLVKLFTDGIVRRQATLTATIANGASLSSEIDLAGYSLAAIVMPSSWTTANLTFQASDVSGGTYNDIRDAAGNELSVVASASCVITDIPELAPIRFLKIRSGTSGTPVNQGGSRSLILILKG